MEKKKKILGIFAIVGLSIYPAKKLYDKKKKNNDNDNDDVKSRYDNIITNTKDLIKEIEKFIKNNELKKADEKNLKESIKYVKFLLKKSNIYFLKNQKVKLENMYNDIKYEYEESQAQLSEKKYDKLFKDNSLDVVPLKTTDQEDLINEINSILDEK